MRFAPARSMTEGNLRRASMGRYSLPSMQNGQQVGSEQFALTGQSAPT